ncbi:MAG: metallophosphoesterase family protein [Candidatus Nanohaloarchaea archaeon]|nr:metallophosphoesterase family protein [Candidatus Nanohaloarchaea archaeon]
MEAPGGEKGASPGDGSRSFVLLSDPHFFSNDIDPVDTIDEVESYRERLDCDGLVVAGDVGTADDLAYFEDTEFDWIRAAEGNHDDWKHGIDGIEEDVSLAWEEPVDEGYYDIGLRHDPRDFGLSPVEDTAAGAVDRDVIIYGHAHMPHDRVLDDGTLAIGAGSLAQNYSTKDELPDRSIHEVEISGDEVFVRHYDFETEELVEEACYDRDDDGFRLASRVWTWKGGNELEDRFYEESL